MDDQELQEVRALASSVYPSLAAHGHSIDTCVEQALEIAEKLVLRSRKRADARREVEERGANGGLVPAERPVFPQRTTVGP